jgi:hypothetical protein
MSCDDRGKDAKGNKHSPYLKIEDCVSLDLKNDETESRSITKKSKILL